MSASSCRRRLRRSSPPVGASPSSADASPVAAAAALFAAVTAALSLAAASLCLTRATALTNMGGMSGPAPRSNPPRFWPNILTLVRPLRSCSLMSRFSIRESTRIARSFAHDT